MSLPTLLEELLVVIVLYQRHARESATYLSLLQTHEGSHAPPLILFYDNSPFPARISGKGLIYIHDALNGGVSKAYNMAASCAEKHGKNWLLFLDQDSILPANFFTQFKNAAQSNPGTKVFVPRVYDEKGLLSPFLFHSARGKRIRFPNQTLPLARYRFINSGMFIEYTTFLSAGGYDENIPLDFSDISFGSRLNSITDHIVVIDCDVRHDFSGSQLQNVDHALTRFRFYCAGAFAFGVTNDRRYRFYMQSFTRAVLLTYRYKDSRFLKNFLKQLVYD